MRPLRAVRCGHGGEDRRHTRRLGEAARIQLSRISGAGEGIRAFHLFEAARSRGRTAHHPPARPSRVRVQPSPLPAVTDRGEEGNGCRGRTETERLNVSRSRGRNLNCAGAHTALESTRGSGLKKDSGGWQNSRHGRGKRVKTEMRFSGIVIFGDFSVFDVQMCTFHRK